MTIIQFEKESQHSKDIMIHKVPNRSGYYSMRFYNSNTKHWSFVNFSSYDDALTYAYMVGFNVVQKELQNSIILERGK